MVKEILNKLKGEINRYINRNSVQRRRRSLICNELFVFREVANREKNTNRQRKERKRETRGKGKMPSERRSLWEC